METANTKKQLIRHIKGGEAFFSLEKMLDEITFEKLGERPNGLPYSFYELFYHVFYTQKDIVEFCIAEEYPKSDWPKDYWPKEQAPKNEDQWERLKKQYFKDREKFSDYIAKDETDLSAIVKHGDSQTLLREILLIIEHTAYHTGQMLVVLRLLDLHNN